MHSETSETNKFLNESLKDLKQSFCKKKYHMRVKYKGKSEEKKLFKKSIGTQSLIYEQRIRPGKRNVKENIKNQLDQKQSITKKLTDLLKTQESLWKKSRRRQSTGQNAYAYLRESLKPRRKFKPLLSRNNSIIPDETEILLPKETQLQISTKVSKLRKSLEYLKQNVKTSASLINSPNPVIQKSMFKQDRKSDGQDIQTCPVTNPLYLPKKYKKVWMDESFSLTLIDQPSLPSAIRSPVS
uniref:Uncharacterized protein n=1 Tax=Euplotes crassus TaxID=5936 RepID=A0A7S3P093_EUPCR|mmetsp:Transcript_4019/g.3797  ORF Transcript_4019/g.3797 Transcript_4019/m.3797 type:complete len:241 (+) Transcript_4019:379-1101(+)